MQCRFIAHARHVPISRNFLYITLRNVIHPWRNQWFFIAVGEQYRALHSINWETITFNEVQWNSRHVPNTPVYFTAGDDTTKMSLFKLVCCFERCLLWKYSLFVIEYNENVREKRENEYHFERVNVIILHGN